ncbi:MAG TPA: helix-turn-helix transcriptional regulator [Pyrinomonadaceae bacterium]|nr:helix-turn-helix transcriptional regulator [Pyrinomonadaceae bacterium]
MSSKKLSRKTSARQVLSKHEKVEASTGNVFADLGLPDAEELLLKSQLAVSIAELVEQAGWTKTETARRAGIDHAKISNVLRGRLSGFSSNRLSAILDRLGNSVGTVSHR